MDDVTDRCACGRPLHYPSPSSERMVRQLIARAGENVTVMVDGRRWRVQRHYIALHGLHAQDLILGLLPFEELPADEH